ncbi:hypothetical protein D3C85_929670 [compost metagenome]
MRDKTVIGFVRDAIDPVLLNDIQSKMVERFGTESLEFVELTSDYGYGKCALDFFGPAPHELERTIRNSIRQSFRVKYADRIDRYNRVWPRHGCPMLQWNRKGKWLPRFYDTPRKLYFSQSQLRLSQVSSWRNIPDSRPHTVCSLEGLDLSRWP